MLEHVFEVRGVRAVDHVVGGTAVGGRVDLEDRVGKRNAVWQPAVGLHGERDRHRHPGVPRRSGDADRLVDVGHRQRRDEVRLGVGKRRDLLGVVAL
jgi:hypothetical protein